MDSLSLILETLARPEIGAVLDIGCGNGLLARALIRNGHEAHGIDPAADAVAEARVRAPDAHVCVGDAERLPYVDGSFGAAIFLNSLHHVGRMPEALREAARIVAPGGTVIVIEPLTDGSYFRAFLAIEDETDVRLAAQDAVQAIVAERALGLVRSLDYDRWDAFTGLPQFLERAAAADRSREGVILAREAEIAAAFASEAVPAPDGRVQLNQPLRAHVLAVP